MKKSDLKTGMKVIVRNRVEFVVLLNTKHGDILSGKGCWASLADYSDDLTFKRFDGSKDFDILRVYSPRFECKYSENSKEGFDLIWVREEFKPYLSHNDAHYGVIGESTIIKDALDRPLEIGDVVDIYHSGSCRYGNSVIVMGFVFPFFWGAQEIIYNDKGEILDGYKIIKKRSHEEVDDNQYIGDIKYIKK